MQRRKSITISIFSLLLAVCLALGLFFTLPKNAKAETSATIGEIYKGSYFDEDNMKALFAALTGKSDATFEDVENAVYPSGKESDATPISSDTFRNLHSGTNVKITFNGIEWYAMQLNVVRKTYTEGGAPEHAGDVILTLWQTKSTINSKFSNTTSNSIDATVKYPSNMYSTSEIRVKALNNGGYYSTSLTEAEQYDKVNNVAQNIYAPFTSESAANNCVKFLIQPKDVEYQETQTAYETYYPSMNRKLQNECYGKDTTSDHWYGSAYNYNRDPSGETYEFGRGDPSIEETNYNYWKNDYIWLPSMAEVLTPESNNDFKGNWKADNAARANDVLTWTRSGIYDYDIRYSLYIYSNGTGWNFTSTTGECAVRPAIHLNLTAAGKALGCTLPTSYEEQYTGLKIEKEILDAEKLDVGTASAGAEYKYDPLTKKGTLTATNVGTYTLDVTPKEGYAWTDGSKDKKQYTLTITHAKINVAFPDNSSDKRNFGHKIEYIYHDDGTTHALKFPDTEDAAATRKIISLTAGATDDDKQNLHIYYKIKTHNEDACPGDEINTANKPAENDGGWKEYTKGDSELNVAANVLKGYCVYYKITAPNHETLIDWFSVHIMKEELTITAAVTIPSVTYGSAPHKQDALKALVLPQITQIADQDGEIRYSKGGADNKLNGDKFLFYFTRSVDGRLNEYRTTDDEGSPDRWPAGEYTLAVKYTDNTDDNNYISFKWANGAPKFTIDPMEVALKWTGNEDWGEDGADVIALASQTEQAKMADEFNWVYDNNTHAPKATFKDADGKDIDVTVTVGSGNPKDANSNAYEAEATIADKNYTIKKGDEKKEFYIRKAANRWISEYWREGWSIGGDPSEEHNANALWGTPKKEYFTNPERSDKFQGDFNNIVQDTTIYVKITVTGTPNYDGLESDDSDKYKFSIVTCDHPNKASAQYEADATGKHFRRCPDCKQKLDLAEHVADENADKGTDANNHWDICKVCKAKFNSQPHTYNIAGNIITAADCTKTGEQEFSCECGATKVQTIGMTKHQPSADWQTDGEKHWHLCKVCGEIADEKQSHNAVIDAAVPNTCVLPGKTSGSHCSECGYKIIEQKDLPALGHNEDDLVIVPATCTKEGSRTGTCSRCNESVNETIPKIAHNYQESVIKEASCTEEGQKAMVCTSCGATQENSTTAIPLTSHALQHVAGKEPTATSSGNLEYWKCTRCSHMYSDQNGTIETDETSVFLPALGISGGGNQSLGGDTGLNNSGSDVGEFFKQNWWWMVLILAAILLIIITLAIISAIRTRKREKLALERERLAAERDRERDRQLDTLIKMQMMHSYGGFNMAAPPADGDAPALDGQPQPAQLPYNQEMFNAAVSAAVTSALAAINHENGGNHDGGGSGGSDDGKGNTVDDVDGFYDDL